jgi:hypothetical protein
MATKLAAVFNYKKPQALMIVGSAFDCILREVKRNPKLPVTARQLFIVKVAITGTWFSLN